MRHARIFLVSCLLSFIVSFSISSAANLDVNIEENLAANITAVNYEKSSLSQMSTEVYNVGTVPYTARVSIDVFKEGKKVFTGWSSEKGMYPGDRHPVNIYWYSTERGNYDAVLRLHYANSISEKNVQLENFERVAGEDVFKIQDLRTYEDKIIFDVISTVDAEDAVVIPENYPTGWIIEQVQIGKMEKGSKKTFILRYEPAIWYTSQMNLVVASNDGKYATVLTFPIERQTGLSGSLNYIEDYFRAKMAGLEL